jgi:glycosyltransferase involved in cell wall biosynthesis
MDASRLAVVVAAYGEEDRIGATVQALHEAFPGSLVVVADDGSPDGTAAAAERAGAQVVRLARRTGKGGAASQAAEVALASAPELVLLCDADLGKSAGALAALVEAVEAGECDLAIAAFRRRVGGGFGVALRFSRWAIERRAGRRFEAPISGQRAMRAEVLRAVLPFAAGYGMETAMTIDAVRSGYRIAEIELDLEHRATFRTPAGFLHRARQLVDFGRVYVSRR